MTNGVCITGFDLMKNKKVRINKKKVKHKIALAHFIYDQITVKMFLEDIF